MKITRVDLEGVRCFTRCPINLAAGDTPRKWTLLLGDNGCGKTTLLRCIAMGLCDESSASALLRDAPGDLIRAGCGEAKITLDLRTRAGECFRTITTIRKQESYEALSQELRKKKGQKYEEIAEADFPWKEIFVCGYGACRGVEGSEIFPGYKAVEATYTLFEYTQPLQNPELAYYRIIESLPKGDEERRAEARSWIKQTLLHVLMLDEYAVGELDFTSTGMEVVGPWGRQPLSALGDGHKAVIVLLLDLLFWHALASSGRLPPQAVKGIVLLDEIEQHLHPRWQRRIIGRLAQRFQDLQFIVTTHSPLCALGMTDLQDEECALFLLRQEEDHTTPSGPHLPPRGQRADQVLTSYLFDLLISGDNATQMEIERYAQLRNKSRSPEEEKEVRSLRETIGQKLGSGETELERHVAKAVSKVLAQEPDANRFDPKALNWEIKRQLRELLE